jgi:ArsR family transcriptional regulator, arsenate/arsenite/antimonite-responsive transcriptional repressor
MMTSANSDTTVGSLFKVLADPLRRRIVELLAREQLCTCHLVEETGAGQTTISNHLRILREADMVDTEPRGRFTYYRLRPEVLHALAAQVAELAAAADEAQSCRRAC